MTILGRFGDRFSSFFEVASRERLDSQREGPNPVLYWQVLYFQGFADFAEKPKTDQNRRKTAPTMLRERAVQEKLDFSAPGRDLASILVVSVRSRELQGALSDVPEHLRDSLGAPGARRGRPKTLPRRSRDAFGTLLDATMCPERVLGAILSRFWVLRGVSGD